MTSSANAVRRVLTTAVVACAAGLAAACGASAGPAATATATATVTPGSSAGAGGAASPSPDPAGQAQAAPPACATSALQGKVAGPGSSAAQVSTYALSLTNISGASCTLYGFPGVSFVTGVGGWQIGIAATRAEDNATFGSATPRLVTLAPGQTVHAVLQVHDATVYSSGECGMVTAHWLRVYPPNQTAPLYVRFTAHACSTSQVNILTIWPVLPVGAPAP